MKSQLLKLCCQSKHKITYQENGELTFLQSHRMIHDTAFYSQLRLLARPPVNIKYNPLTNSTSRVLLEKVILPELVKKFPTFNGTPTFITRFKTAYHLFLSTTMSSVYALSSYFFNTHLNIILPAVYVSSKKSLSFRLSHQLCQHFGSPCCIPHPSFNLILFG